ncbi:MAG: hypothetical protein VW080_05150, partial [Flavobacteriaceae bacterium]
IDFLLIKEPVFCKKCSHFVSEKSCGHHQLNNHVRISGSEIRQNIREAKLPSHNLMRPEIMKSLLDMDDEIFIKD